MLIPSSSENITDDSLEDHIDFIYDDNDLENYMRNRSAEKSALIDRNTKVRKLEEQSIIKNKEAEQIKETLILNSENAAKSIHRVYRTVAKLLIGIVVVLIAGIGYVLKQETDSTLSIIVFVISGISLLISLGSWKAINFKISFLS